MILYNVGWLPPIVMLGGCSEISDFDFLVIASSWIWPPLLPRGKGPRTDAATNPCCHSQPPTKPDLFLNEATAHWAIAKENQGAVLSRYPWWKSLFSFRSCVSLLSHLICRICTGRWWESTWTLATVKTSKSSDSTLFTFLLCFSFETAPYWWVGGPYGSHTF